jgi:hypothetical protein
MFQNIENLFTRRNYRYLLTLIVVGIEDMKRKLANATGLKEVTLAATRRVAIENMI